MAATRFEQLVLLVYIAAVQSMSNTVPGTLATVYMYACSHKHACLCTGSLQYFTLDQSELRNCTSSDALALFQQSADFAP